MELSDIRTMVAYMDFTVAQILHRGQGLSDDAFRSLLQIQANIRQAAHYIDRDEHDSAAHV